MSAAIDISPDQRKTLLALFKRYIPNTKVWAFGSRVKWKARSNSDLDLVVFTNAQQADKVAELKEMLEESALPFRVDLLVWDKIPESFRSAILEQYVVLVEAEPLLLMGYGADRAKKITDIVDFNPKRSIEKGRIAPFVDMAALSVDSRDISVIDEREFNGGGSKFKNGDTLFARITPCLENGKTAKVSGLSEKAIAHGSTEFIVMAAKDPIYDEDYVYYLARLPEFRSYAQARMEGTSGRQRVSWQSLAEFGFDFPPKEARRQIGAFLKSIDDKIALNTQTNQTLEAIAQAIFKSWFVDFEPVKAKMAVLEAGGTAEEVERAAMCAISGKDEAALSQLQTEQPDAYAELAQTAALFPSAMQDSELGEIPEGWSTQNFSKFAQNVRESIKAENTKDHEIYVGLEHIDRISLTLSRWGSGGDVESNKSAFIKGDVLFGKLRPYFHKVAIAPINGICSTDILVIRPKKSFYAAFVILQTFSPDFVEHANLRSTGTRMPRASWNDMASYLIATPNNDNVFLKFNERMSPLLNSLGVRNGQSIALAELRDTLLPKLLSGELTLPPAEAAASESDSV